MNYPLILEYIEAIKSAEDNFEELSYLSPVLGDDGLPVMTNGNFAVVFKMKDERDGKFYAVKCFTKEQKGRAEAYREIAKELKGVSSPYLVSFRYLEKELFVDTDQTNETEFPVLLMDWVEGKTLDKYLRENLDGKYALEMLAYRFSQLAQWLIPQPFAHGDLKPDNILVREDGTLVLVDYDGMYVPAMKGQKARELGSPDFRHPQRTENDFDEHIDDFPLVSILLSLKVISMKPFLWDTGYCDRLLFSDNDYRCITNSVICSEIQTFLNTEDCRSIMSVFFLCLYSKNIPVSYCKYLCVYFEGMNNEKYALLSSELKETISKAIMGDMAEENSLGYKYYYGEDLCQDYAKAIYWYRASASYNYPKALYNLGICYQQGTGVEQSNCEALKWFLKAAEKGDADAQYNVGLYYRWEKYGVGVDLQKSFTWFLKSAEQGHPSAQCQVGGFYQYGKGEIEINKSEAFKWYSLSAQQGDKYGQYHLAKCYYYGLGVNRNYKKALKLFSLAANQGLDKAQKEITCVSGEWCLNAHYSDDGETFERIFTYTETYEIMEGTKYITEQACSDMGWEIDCNSLRKLIIPHSIVSIGDNPFGSQISEVICLSPFYEIDNKTLYTIGKKELIQCYNHETEEYVIPEGVEIIRSYAFYACDFRKVIIPSSVSKIGENPFIETGIWKNCHKTLEVLSNSPLYNVLNDALYERNRLIAYWGESDLFELPSGIEVIGKKAFWGSSVRSIKLPTSLKTVAEDSFYWTEKLKEIVIPANEFERFKQMLPQYIHDIVVEDLNLDEMPF